MWKEENHHRFSFCCDLWMLAYGCLGMYYMCKCVLVSCKSWFKTHMCGWCLVSNATNSRSTVPTKSRFTVRSQPRSSIHTLQQRSRTHLKSKNEKELFPIIRALDSPFSVHMEAICTHFHPLYPVCICIYGWLCWCGEFCVWIGFRLNTDLHIYSNRTRVYKWRTNRKITPYTISPYTK